MFCAPPFTKKKKCCLSVPRAPVAVCKTPSDNCWVKKIIDQGKREVKTRKTAAEKRERDLKKKGGGGRGRGVSLSPSPSLPSPLAPRPKTRHPPRLPPPHLSAKSNQRLLCCGCCFFCQMRSMVEEWVAVEKNFVWLKKIGKIRGNESKRINGVCDCCGAKKKGGTSRRRDVEVEQYLSFFGGFPPFPCVCARQGFGFQTFLLFLPFCF